MMLTLSQAHALLPQSTLVGDGSIAIYRVHTDTRSLQHGDLFVALKGDQFDAHDFLHQAHAKGAVAAIAEHALSATGLPGLHVVDTQQALTQLARAWRQQIKLPLIAVTGSNGKTTVTQMIASMLCAWLGDGAFATAGNFNNHIGVPLTLLGLRSSHRAAVVELGMNHPGEIAALANITAPTVVLVNNAQREHQEFMENVGAVAHENGSAISSLGNSGIAVFPADDAHASIWRDLAGRRPIMTFALTGAADVICKADWQQGELHDYWVLRLQTPLGSVSCKLQVAGSHNVKNALAATACALAAGCPLEAVQRGLESFTPVKGRSQVQRVLRAGQNVTLINDTYNANPDSVRAAIEVLASLPGPRWLVLGDMGEVGTQGPAFHREVGAFAQARGINALWTVGTACQHTAQAFAGARHFDDVSALIGALSTAPACVSVAIKGSRFMQMERVVMAWTELCRGTNIGTGSASNAA
jgi:UDP-N-acetylmuramoyl-tripeptide--D-alanyl-D-alanine ligase